ncbi:MAG: DUF1572 domain-containing protein [Ignavibacteria bacterium]|nr:DUF1572 domain-containing protein [Ignavibacteria bacterium]
MENNISENTLVKEFIRQSNERIILNLPRIEKCLDELNDYEIWTRQNNSSNSIGNLILHLCGNITQYIISGLGGETDNRNRDEEFAANGGFNSLELKDKIRKVINRSAEVIESLSEEELLQQRTLQGYQMTGIAAIIHVTEHLSYHTGQIVFYTKMLKDIDTGFYKGLNLNTKNLI